ncbi:MAG TPA: hydrolase [Tissierellaceae bacterium]|nr:hydrolase [Tissierellaceae bacterium]
MEKFNLNREDSVLFVIDIQEKLVPAMKGKEKVIDNNRILLEGAKEMNIPIIATEQYPKGLGSTVDEIKEFLNEEDIFSKNSFTAYIDDVKEKLEELNKKKIIITGMETHVCVYQTTRDLIEAGYDVHVVNDGVASRTKENYINALEQMKEMGAVINNTETIVFDLLKIAGTPEFKKMSKLIK